MNKFVKDALIFTGGVAGGFVLCGLAIGKAVIKSNTFREVVKNKISEEIDSILYGKNRRPKVSCRSYHYHKK